MEQYADSFSRERVSGEILLDCDDEILKEELGMASRLHRVRFMKILLGKHSAKNIISGLDAYAHT